MCNTCEIEREWKRIKKRRNKSGLAKRRWVSANGGTDLFFLSPLACSQSQSTSLFEDDEDDDELGWLK